LRLDSPTFERWQVNEEQYLQGICAIDIQGRQADDEQEEALMTSLCIGIMSTHETKALRLVWSTS
jgi:hypothetical protein